MRPFGPGSPFAAFLELDAWILMLVVSFQSCTALHAVEYLRQDGSSNDFAKTEAVFREAHRGGPPGIGLP